MQLAKSLIGNVNVHVYTVAQFIYKKSFELLERRFKHLLIQILIEHITCSADSSRDNSLDVLLDLCTVANSSASISAFSLELKSLLNFIDYLNLAQIKKVYFILCSIAYSASSSNAAINAKLLEKLPSVSSIQSQAYPSSSIPSTASTVSAHKQIQPTPSTDFNPSAIQDNLHILINKQLSSNILKYKQMGVIGILNLTFHIS